MIIKDKMCYARLIQLMQHPGFAKSVDKVTFTKPNIEHQGMAGYIETEVTIELCGKTNLLGIAHVLSGNPSHEEYLNIYNGLIR